MALLSEHNRDQKELCARTSNTSNDRQHVQHLLHTDRHPASNQLLFLMQMHQDYADPCSEENTMTIRRNQASCPFPCLHHSLDVPIYQVSPEGNVRQVMV